MSDNTDPLTDRLRRSAGTDAPAPALSPELVAAAPGRRAPRLVNHGRTTRFASASLAAVAAVAVGSLVVTNPFAPQAPLFTAAAAGSGPANAQSAETSALADDARIAMWIDYDYVAGPGLGTEGGSGGVYQLRRVGSPEQVLADMAERFGVDGEAVESQYFDPEWPSYVVGPEDGSGPSIMVTWSGTGNWWYNNPAAYPDPVCELVEYETENGTEQFEECIAPEIPASESLAPSEAEARAQAAELFASMGLDVQPGDVRVFGDVWQTMATASLRVDGVDTAIDYSVAWSPLGEIAWAYGHSIEVVDRGDFGTVSATEAVARLDDGRWYGAAGPDFQGGMNILAAESGVARDAVPATAGGDTSVSSPADEPTEPGTPGEAPVEPTEPVEPSEPTEPTEPAEPTEPTEPVEPTEPGEEPIVEPTTEPAPLPEPEQVTVTVDSAEATLLLMWDADGNAWLVPGFAMQHPDGFFNTIVSLVEGVIELPAPFEGEITPFLED
ncbi:hypothetical protein [Microcella sp.]|uniref:hypothetical protein n=1 Tax=Microcella sp. TaxID=1913979 RepID=UPI00391C57A7